MFLVNSRSPQFTATQLGSRLNKLSPCGHTFSRSYGAILPSSLTRVLSNALVFSTCLPVSVYGTVTNVNVYEAFPGSLESTTLQPFGLRHHASALTRTRICLSPPPTRLNRDNQRPDGLSFFVPPYTISTSAVREC
jgi:hypothetical protein